MMGVERKRKERDPLRAPVWGLSCLIGGDGGGRVETGGPAACPTPHVAQRGGGQGWGDWLENTETLGKRLPGSCHWRGFSIGVSRHRPGSSGGLTRRGGGLEGVQASNRGCGRV